MKKSILLAVLTVFIWGTLSTTAKVLLNEIPNFEVLAISSAFAFLFLFVAILFSKAKKEIKNYSLSEYGKMAGLGVIGIFLYSALYYYGIANLTSQTACIINYLWPIMIIIFSAPILKERLTSTKIIAMVCSFVGVIILTLGGNYLSQGNKILGVLACFADAVCYGLFSVLNKRKNYNRLIFMAVVWLVSAILSFLTIPFATPWVSLSTKRWLGLLYLGVVVNGFAYLTWALALNNAKNTALVSNIAFLTPFLALIISAIFIHEQIKVNAVVALILIVGGIFIQNIKTKKGEQNGRKITS